MDRTIPTESRKSVFCSEPPSSTGLEIRSARILRRALVVLAGAVLFWGALPAGTGAAGIGISRTTNPERVEIALLDRAKERVDIAMAAGTHRTIARELAALASRGVRVRIYRDFHRSGDRNDPTRILAGKPGIEIRIKNTRRTFDIVPALAFAVDGRILLEGSANRSQSGIGAACRREYCDWNGHRDDPATVSVDPELVKEFEDRFERMWERPENIKVGAR